MREIEGKEFLGGSASPVVEGHDFEKTRFSFVAAKQTHFRQVSFMFCVFEDCYFRDCRFEDCDFTGAVFRNSTLRGSTFDGCKFPYCRFSHTLISHAILERNMPGFENVALELARSLRVNFSQLGDSVGVNVAVSAELEATRVHFYKAAWSPEAYYRKKHAGLGRVRAIGAYAWFRVQDTIWGHGESLWKLGRFLMCGYAVLAVVLFWRGAQIGSAFREAWMMLWGVGSASRLVATVAVAFRTVALGLFVTVLVRRFSRR